MDALNDGIYEYSGRIIAKTLQDCGARMRREPSPPLDLTGATASTEAFSQSVRWFIPITSMGWVQRREKE